MTTSKTTDKKTSPALEHLMTMNAYAKHQGVSHTAVRKAIDSGRLVKSVVNDKGRTLIHAEVADIEWAKNTDKAKQGNRKPEEGKGASPDAKMLKVVEAGKSDSVKAEASSILNGLVSEGILDINEARAMKETFLAKMAQLEYHRKLGQLVENAVVRKTAFAIANTVKNRLTALPARISPQVMGQTSQAVIAGIIKEEVTQALTELASMIMDIQKLMDGDEHSEVRRQALKEEQSLSSLDGEEPQPLEGDDDE